jgi:serine/threonine protein phosphatase PrpC
MDQNGFGVVAASHKGKIKLVNEDNGIIRMGVDNNGMTVALYGVADGMGGLAAGDVASGIAIEFLGKWWEGRIASRLKGASSSEGAGRTENLEVRGKTFDLKVATHELGDIFNEINYTLIQEGKRIGKRIGTTLSVMFHMGKDYIIVHIGDSRVYRLNKRLEQLTDDHSWVAEQVRNGNMTKEEAANHPSRHILTECLGVNEKIHLFFNSGSLKPGDTILICSDGFYTMVKENDWKDVIQTANNKYQALRMTANVLVEMANHSGGEDNITVLLVSWKKETSWFNKLFLSVITTL